MFRSERHKRAQRRRAEARKKQRARKLYPDQPYGKLRNHLTVCSCRACGNPRRHFGERTLAELRFLQSMRQQISDLEVRPMRLA